MAETIISQLDRAFANPLETDRQVNFISDRDAISALVRWEGMQVYVKSELTTFELRGGILNEHWTDASGIDSANYTPTGGYAGTAQDIVDSIEITTSGVEIISITHIENLDYYVIANPYKIGSEYYTAAPTTVTLTVGDATFARIDVIYADVNGVIGVLEGTPSASPIKEVVDLPTQRELTFRTVPALATVDPLVTNELVFDENTGVVGGEWDVLGAGLTNLDFNSTAVAFSGTKSIYFDGVNPYFYVDFENDVNISLSDISTFYFRVYLPELIDRNAEIVFQLLDTSFNIAGSARIVKDGYFGLDRNVLNSWQIISIPIAFFNYPFAEFKGIRFTVSRSRKPKMYMDALQFQFNVAQPAPLVNPLRITQLTDVEKTFVGNANKFGKVNAGETLFTFENVTKSDVGLSNVDNTSDVDKPVSTAQQTALNLKLNNTDALTAVSPTNKLITEDDIVGLSVSISDTYSSIDYGVLGDGIDFTTGSITTGTATLVVSGASFVSGDVGKIVVVVGAGVAGDFLKSSILSVTNSTTVVLNNNASTTVSAVSGFYGTDDTANIQTAINTIYGNGGGTLIFPKGIFVLNGVLQTNIGGINPNSQLYIPYQAFEDLNRNTLVITSNSIPSFQQGSAIVSLGNRRASNSGTVFRSTITGSGTTPSILASKGQVDPSNSLAFNAANIIIKGINFQSVPYGNKINLTYINFAKTNTMVLEEVIMMPYYIRLDETLQPDSTVNGVIMNEDSTGNISRMKSCYIAGFYNGIVVGDHSFLEDNMTLACYNGLVFPFLYHQPYIYGQLIAWCKNYITITGVVYVNIHDLDIEFITSAVWYSSDIIINDINNYGKGRITYHIVEGTVGVNYSKFSKLGGDNLMIMPLGLSKEDVTISGTTDAAKLSSLLTSLVNLGFIKIASLLPYYRFNNDLIDINTSLNGTGTNIGYAVGKGGNALDLLGGASYVSVLDNDKLSFVAKGYAIEFMVYFDVISANQVIVNKRDATFSEYQVSLTNGNMRLALFNGSTSGAYLLCDTSGFTFNINTWYHVVCTDDGTIVKNKKIYINTVLQTMTHLEQNGTYSGMTNTTAPIYIGTQGTSLGSNSLNGRLQRLGYFHELSQAEITSNYTTEFTNELDLY